MTLNNESKSVKIWYNDISVKTGYQSTNSSAKTGMVEKYSIHSVETVERAEDWISICFTIESELGVNKMEDYWQSGLSKFHKSLVYLESIGFYYFRAGKHHKALKYLKKAHDINHSPLAINISIASAYALAQYHLVWDYFNLLKKEEKVSLEDDLISKVATSALQQGMYNEAEKLFQLLGQRNGIQQLPDLEKSLLDNFGNKEKMEDFYKEINEKAKDKKSRKKVSLQQWIAFASVLMYREKYEEAVEILTTVKEESYS